jgi:hypothetical protein
MNDFSFRRLILIPIFPVAIIYFFLNGCTPGFKPDELSLLNRKNDSIAMAMELDSLHRLLVARDLKYDTISSSYTLMLADLKKADDQIKNLRSGYYSRGQQIKKVNDENGAMKKNINSLNVQKDSLRTALALAQQELIESEHQKASADSISSALEISMAEIEKKRITDSIEELKKPAKDKSVFISINEIGGGYGLGNRDVDYSGNVLSVNTIAAYKINNHFITGIGTGLSFYNGGTMVPLYLDFRYIFREKEFKPFIVADGGFLFVLNDFSTSGFFINPAVGASRRLSEKISLHLSTGLLVQAAPAGPESGGFRRSFINIKAGISFMGK